MKTIIMCLLLCILILFSSTESLYADIGEQLILRYYHDSGIDLISGQAKLLNHVYKPILDKELFMPSENEFEGLDEAGKTEKLNRYFKYLSESYGANFTQGAPEDKYLAIEIYYEGENKRKNLANLDEPAYQLILNKKDGFKDLAFERYFDNGSKMTSINDQEGLNKLDPQVIITPDKLGIPPINRFGKPRLDPKFCSIMEERIKTGFYSVSSQETKDGLLIVAESTRSKLKKIELLFKKYKDDYAVSCVRQYNNFDKMIDEEQYENYILTPSKTLFPTKILIRTFMPIPVLTEDGTLKQLVSYQEEFTVLEADFNVDVPDEIFVPTLPYGATVYDTTVSPPLQYLAYKVENANKEDFFESDALDALEGKHIIHDTNLQEINKQKTKFPTSKSKGVSPVETRNNTANPRGSIIFLLSVSIITLLLLVFVIYNKLTTNHSKRG